MLGDHSYDCDGSSVALQGFDKPREAKKGNIDKNLIIFYYLHYACATSVRANSGPFRF
jgi:hypothetical protein